MTEPVLTDPASIEPIRALQRLRAAGFAGSPIMNSNGQLDALLLSRVHRGVIDCVLMHSETVAIACRVRDDHSLAGPFRPLNAVLWSYGGDLVTTVGEVLDLPAPGERYAPNLAHRPPSELWAPTTTAKEEGK